MSNYQSLARYHEDRQRDRMPTMRQLMRNDIGTSRFTTKLQQRFRLRGISEECPDEDESACQDLGYDEVDGFEFSEETNAFEQNDQYFMPGLSNRWTSSLSHPNAPSPSLSHDSDYSTSSSYSGWGDSSPCISPVRRPRPKQGQARSRKDILLHRKRVQEMNRDPQEVERRYRTLKANIVSRLDDPLSVRRIMCASWNVLSDAMYHENDFIVRDSLDFLTQLVERRSLPVADLLFMFQQGLILAFRPAVSRFGSQQSDLVALLTCIVMVEPCATPYLVELMRDTGMIAELESLLVMGSDSEVLMVVVFYQRLFETLSRLLASEPQLPVVPETILSTTSSEELVRAYNPHVAFKHLISDKILNQLISRFFAHIGCDTENATGLAMMVCAEILNFVHRNYVTIDQGWSRDVYKLFQDWDLGRLIERQLNSRSPRVIKSQMKNFSVFYENMCKALTRLMT